MLNQEITVFCENWLDKATKIDDSTMAGSFDKFFTLYVVYNRLYVETTYRMFNEGQINLQNRTTFPDDMAAKNYVVQFLGCKFINAQFNADQNCKNAIRSLIQILKQNQFNIKLNQISGMPQPNEDKRLLGRLESNQIDRKVKAIADFIYSVRCNVFHAQKSYVQRQTQILNPVNILLEKLINLLFSKLQSG